MYMHVLEKKNSYTCMYVYIHVYVIGDIQLYTQRDL